jgi:hypothetical protein
MVSFCLGCVCWATHLPAPTSPAHHHLAHINSSLLPPPRAPPAHTPPPPFTPQTIMGLIAAALLCALCNTPAPPPTPTPHPLPPLWRACVPGPAESWRPIHADPAHIARCRGILQQAGCLAAACQEPFTDLAATAAPVTGPTRYTTGLGLPLSRALARAANGWLGLDDQDLAPKPALAAGAGAGAACLAPGAGAARGITTYWCVMEAPPSPAPAPAPAPAPGAATVAQRAVGAAAGAGASAGAGAGAGTSVPDAGRVGDVSAGSSLGAAVDTAAVRVVVERGPSTAEAPAAGSASDAPLPTAAPRSAARAVFARLRARSPPCGRLVAALWPPCGRLVAALWPPCGRLVAAL